MKRTAFILAPFLLFPAVAFTVPFEQIRVGDIDGFGYGVASGYLGADHAPANRGAGGVLGTGDMLPDLNNDGSLATGSKDDFDNRSSESISCVGCASVGSGSTGQSYTDIALSTSYDDSNLSETVYNANTSTYGSGGAFPASTPSSTRSNQPKFVFDFSVAATDIATSATIVFNLVFADYDVPSAEIRFTLADSSSFIQEVDLQPENLDGLIQVAFAGLLFDQVFTLNGDVYEGYLEIEFIADREPYTAFDFVELSTGQFAISSVPEPASWILVGVGLAGIDYQRRRLLRQRSTHSSGS